MMTPMTWTTLQISIVIGCKRKNNRADVKISHLRDAHKWISVSNSEEKKRETNLRYWQCNWSIR